MAGDRIRLVKFVACFGRGGTERQFTNLALGLNRARFELGFGCLSRDGALRDEIEAAGIGVSEYPIRSFYHPGATLQQLRFARDLRRVRATIVHTYNFYANVFAVPAARLAGVPVVVASIRDMGVYLTPAQRLVQRQVCRLADRVLVNAEAVRRWLVSDGYDPARIAVVGNGIDLRDVGGEPPDLRAELGAGRDAPVVLLVSRLVPRKGIEDFLEAVARLAGGEPQARFAIAGDEADGTGYRSALERYAMQLGLGSRVRFLGARRDVPALLGQASVSVLPSLSEGLSNVLLESMAAGVPVVATRVGGAPEVIDDGRTGLLVPAGRPGELARAILRLLEHPELAARLGLAGRQTVRTRYSLDGMVAATEAHYLELLRASRRSPPRTSAAVAR
jgi:glycosyltransferase involved in cell wall biosynthesis